MNERYCKGCGGRLGVDCWNEADCVAIARDKEAQQQTACDCTRLERKVLKLKEALRDIVYLASHACDFDDETRVVILQGAEAALGGD